MDPLVLSAVLLGSAAAAATAIANWRLARQSAHDVRQVRDEAEQRAAAAAGLEADGQRWRGQRAGRDVWVEFTRSTMAESVERNLGAIGHITCRAHERATFQLDDADVVSDLGLDININDATIDPFVRIRGSDADDVRVLLSSPIREFVRDALVETRMSFTALRLSEGGNNRPVRLPRFRRLWLDDDGLHIEWHHDRIDAHTRTSLAALTVDTLAELAFQLEAAMSEPRTMASAADTATAAAGSSVAVRPF